MCDLKRITFYDGAYICLARLIESPLLTADRLQAMAGKLLGIRTIPLKDYQ